MRNKRLIMLLTCVAILTVTSVVAGTLYLTNKNNYIDVPISAVLIKWESTIYMIDHGNLYELSSHGLTEASNNCPVLIGTFKLFLTANPQIYRNGTEFIKKIQKYNKKLLVLTHTVGGAAYMYALSEDSIEKLEIASKTSDFSVVNNEIAIAYEGSLPNEQVATELNSHKEYKFHMTPYFYIGAAKNFLLFDSVDNVYVTYDLHNISNPKTASLVVEVKRNWMLRGIDADSNFGIIHTVRDSKVWPYKHKIQIWESNTNRILQTMEVSEPIYNTIISSGKVYIQTYDKVYIYKLTP